MKYTPVLPCVVVSFLLLCMHCAMPVTAGCSTRPELDSAVDTQKTAVPDAAIQEKLKSHYEKNAIDLMDLLKEHKFAELEQFLDYVIKNKIKTRHGEDYLSALLHYWFSGFNTGIVLDEALLAHLDAWVEQDQKNALARLARGNFYLSWGWEARGFDWAKGVKPHQWRFFEERLDKASQDFMYVYKRDAGNIHAQLGLFKISVDSSQQKEQNQIPDDLYQQILARDPDNFAAHEIRLRQLMPKWGGNWWSLFRFARQTEKNAPSGTLLPMILVWAHAEAAARSGDEKKYYALPEIQADVERAYQAVIRSFPRSGRWKTRFGNFLNKIERCELARKYWLEAVETDPYNLEAHASILWLYNKEEKWDLEEKYARHIVKLYPYYARGYSYLGQSSLDLKKFPEALAAFTRAIELKPQDAYYRMQRCWAYNWMREYEKAIDDCTHAIAFDEENVSAYKQREHAYRKLGRHQEADADSKRYDEIKSRRQKEK